jgi:hypothetical protein
VEVETQIRRGGDRHRVDVDLNVARRREAEIQTQLNDRGWSAA